METYLKKRVSQYKDSFVDATKLTLAQWLELVKKDKEGDRLFINYCFPTDELRREYLQTIASRSESEVKGLLRHFLMESGGLGLDELQFLNLMRLSVHNKSQYRKLMQIEHVRHLQKGFFQAKVWEGNRWILDLLPDSPKLALNALQAYHAATWLFLPDGRIDGLLDSMAIMREKFIRTPRNSLLKSLDPHEFEELIASLYDKMGYSTTLTPMSHDGGRDVIANERAPGRRERLLIQCKRTDRPVGVDMIRSLLGVVSDERATKGVLVCTSRFTCDARRLEERNSRIDLVDHKNLQMLLNKELGPTWPEYLDVYISGRSRVHET